MDDNTNKNYKDYKSKKYSKVRDYIDELISHNRLALAKTITLIESTLPNDQQLAQKIISGILPFTGKSIRIGITGTSGVGKSTFIEKLGLYLANKNHKIAILTIDPSSPINCGSILADKTRMEEILSHSNVFIRPTPSGNHLGGVAQNTRETVLLCEAAGFDVILIETVGVGQSEISTASMVDFFLILVLANAGDEIQGIKKGILELVDSIVINKADKNNLEQAQNAKKIYENAINIISSTSNTWSPLVKICSSLENTGIVEIWEMIINHNNKMKESGEFESKRNNQSLAWMRSIIENRIIQNYKDHQKVKNILPKIETQVLEAKISPTNAAKQILDIIY